MILWECDHQGYFLLLHGQPLYTWLCLTSRKNKALEKKQTFRWRKLLVSALILPFTTQICEREKQPAQNQKLKPAGLFWQTDCWMLVTSWDDNIPSFAVNQEGSLPLITFSPNSFSVYDTQQNAACLTIFGYLMLKKKNKGKGFGFSFTYCWDKTVVAILFSIKNPIFNEYRYCT